MSLIGLDIGTSHIKAVEIEKDKNGAYNLIKYAVIPAHDINSKIFSEDKKDFNDAVDSMKEVLKECSFKTKNIVSTLPEYKIFTKIITMPDLGDKELKQAIEWEANQYLPQPLSEVYLQYTPLNMPQLEDNSKTASASLSDITDKLKSSIPLVSQSKEKSTSSQSMDILLVAAPKDIVQKYMNLLNMCGLYVMGVEPASIATIRAITFSEVDIPTIVMNFGHNNMDFYLVVNNKVRFVRTVQFGVSSLVRAISENLDIPPIQANEYLYTYGFNESDLEGKITQIIKPASDLIIQELKRFTAYTEKRISFNKDFGNSKVRRLVVCGGGALIPNLMVYLVGNISAEIEFADPWDVINTDLVSNKNILSSIGPLFTNAVGAAMK